MEFTDYLLLKKGFKNKHTQFLLAMRTHAYISVSPYAGKDLTPERLWPIDGDKERKKEKKEISSKNLEFLKRSLENPGKNIIVQPSVTTATNRGGRKRSSKGR